MTAPLRASAPPVGRFTSAILFLIVLICVAMIGCTGYLKYQMDRAESLLAAPDAAIGGDQDQLDRLRRALGYGGFLGLAQNYAQRHDDSGFAEMKADIKTADDIVGHLPDRTPAETRHELAAIVATFDNALLRMNAPVGDPAGDFSAADMAPLYAALPTLDARIAASNALTRLAAENRMHFWGMLLTLVSWCSLIIASACAAGIYLALRDKHSAPLRALAQSIQNMARGDMRTSIWGVERQDMVGELARAVDIARYHFSHLPDLSLLSEQGPVRMKFEGGSRSLFEAMMKAIAADSEHIRNQTVALSQAVAEQRETIAAIAQKVESVLGDILQHGQDGDRQIRKAIGDMVGSAENLKNAHAHSADQLNRLIPAIQDRAAGLSEIAHITGKQAAQTLQALTISELGLKAHAEQAGETLRRLSATADDLGERLFGAINLLQASGKILAETTDAMRSRMIGDAAPVAAVAAVPSADMMNPVTQRLDQIAEHISVIDNRLAAPPAVHQADSGEAAQVSETAARLAVSRIEPKLAALDDKAAAIGAAIGALNDKIGKTATGLPPEIQEQMRDQWFQVAGQIEASRANLAETIAQQVAAMESHLAGQSAPPSQARGASDYATQSQIEQQTQILTELVATLGALDAHMQQIKSDMREKRAI